MILGGHTGDLRGLREREVGRKGANDDERVREARIDGRGRSDGGWCMDMQSGDGRCGGGWWAAHALAACAVTRCDAMLLLTCNCIRARRHRCRSVCACEAQLAWRLPRLLVWLTALTESLHDACCGSGSRLAAYLAL